MVVDSAVPRRPPLGGGKAPRPLVKALLMLLVALGMPVAAPAQAAIAAPAEQMPLVITVDRLEPRTVTPDSTITVSGDVTNTADVAMTGLIIRLQRGPLLTTRDDLRANDEGPSSATNGFAPFDDLLPELGAGDTAPFRYETTAAVLGLSGLGVYPLLVNVNGTPAGDVEQRVGQLDTYLPFFSQPPQAPTGVSWLWPLVDRPHRGAEGVFLDDDLADDVAGGGRLDRLLAIAEAEPLVPTTLAVDPLLLESLQAMVAGYRLADGGTGGGGAAAAGWLERLTALARTHQVIALPYADVDLVALTRAGLAGQAADAIQRGREIVADSLGGRPRTDLSWPVDGLVTDPALQVLREAGAEHVVLGSAAFSGSAPERTGSAPTELVGLGAPITAFVSDPVLDGIVAAADSWPTGPRLAEQRYLAELAMITAEAPASSRQLLVLPPRRWDPRTSYALPMLGDTATEPWLRASQAGDLGALAPADRGRLVYPADTTELDAAGMALLGRDVAASSDLESMHVPVTGAEEQVARTITDPLAAAVLQAAASSWRGDPSGFRRAAEDVSAAVDTQRERVFLVVPADGTYSLASAHAPLVFTVENQLPVPVQVRISVDATLVAGLSTDDVGAQILAPASRTLIEVPATVERPGEFRVRAAIRTPAGGTLGDPVRVTVRSTAYGVIALTITAAAAALLLVLFALRLLRRIRRGTGAPPQPERAVRVRLRAGA